MAPLRVVISSSPLPLSSSSSIHPSSTHRFAFPLLAVDSPHGHRRSPPVIITFPLDSLSSIPPPSILPLLEFPLPCIFSPFLLCVLPLLLLQLCRPLVVVSSIIVILPSFSGLFPLLRPPPHLAPPTHSRRFPSHYVVDSIRFVLAMGRHRRRCHCHCRCCCFRRRSSPTLLLPSLVLLLPSLVLFLPSPSSLLPSQSFVVTVLQSSPLTVVVVSPLVPFLLGPLFIPLLVFLYRWRRTCIHVGGGNRSVSRGGM